MTVKYAVSFEFDIKPPVTARGTVSGGSASACVARATRAAVKANPGLRWTSLVCVLLERIDDSSPKEDKAS